MDWTVFFTALVAQLLECMQERRREDVEDGLNEPGFRERRWVNRELRRQGMTGRQLRHETDEAIAHLEEQDAEDISLLLDDAEATALKGAK